MLRPASAEAYSWPLKPFDTQHPVRGFFGDPRIADDHPGEGSSSTSGSTSARPRHRPSTRPSPAASYVETTDPNVVSVASGPRACELSYWHVVPFVQARPVRGGPAPPSLGRVPRRHGGTSTCRSRATAYTSTLCGAARCRRTSIGRAPSSRRSPSSVPVPAAGRADSPGPGRPRCAGWRPSTATRPRPLRRQAGDARPRPLEARGRRTRRRMAHRRGLPWRLAGVPVRAGLRTVDAYRTSPGGADATASCSPVGSIRPTSYEVSTGSRCSSPIPAVTRACGAGPSPSRADLRGLSLASA